MKRFVILLVVVISGTLSFCGEEAARNGGQNLLLENELSLAQTAVSYMVINLEDKAVYLKARGIVLRKWDIQRSKLWGKPIPIKVFKLIKKSALSTPKRTNITPGLEDQKKKEKKDGIELDVLELKDMPLQYNLSFGERISVSIKSRTRRFWPVILNFGKSIYWFTYLPLKTVWLTTKKQTFTELELVMMSEKDAQGIYWSFLDGHGTIIYQQKIK